MSTRMAGAHASSIVAPNKEFRLLLIATVPSTLWAFYRKLPEYLSARGITTAMAAGPGKELDYFREQYGVQTFTLPLTRAISPMVDLGAVMKLRRILHRDKFDIVHAMTPKAGLVGMASARLAGVPARIYTLPGLPAETATGFKRVILVQAERLACRCADRVFAVSDSLRETIARCGIWPKNRIEVLGAGTCCGVDAVRFSRRPDLVDAGRARRQTLGIPEGSVVIGFIGRLVYEKGIHTIVDAFTEIAARRSDIRLLLLGDYEPHRGEVPKRTIEQIQSHPGIIRVPFDWDPLPYYAAVDVLALATLREGFPYALLEAAAMELPVVATRATGCVDAVVDGETGLLVDIGDTEGFRIAMERLIEDADLRRRLGRAARQRVVRLFSEEKMLDAHVELYRSMVAHPNGPADVTRPS